MAVLPNREFVVCEVPKSELLDEDACVLSKREAPVVAGVEAPNKELVAGALLPNKELPVFVGRVVALPNNEEVPPPPPPPNNDVPVLVGVCAVVPKSDVDCPKGEGAAVDCGVPKREVVFCVCVLLNRDVLGAEAEELPKPPVNEIQIGT